MGKNEEISDGKKTQQGKQNKPPSPTPMAQGLDTPLILFNLRLPKAVNVELLIWIIK